MVRSEQESPVPEIGTPGLMWRGLETGPWGPYTGTKLETAETAKGNLPVPRLSSTLLVGGPQETWPMVELGPHLATERARVETPHLPVRAPGIYPDIRTHGSVGAQGGNALCYPTAPTSTAREGALRPTLRARPKRCGGSSRVSAAGASRPMAVRPSCGRRPIASPIMRGRVVFRH